MVGSPDLAQQLGRAIGGIVVDEHRFPTDVGQRILDALQKRPAIADFVQGGNDDGKLQRSGWLGGGRRFGWAGRWIERVLQCRSRQKREDRKSVGEGKGVSGRVDRGGSCIMK